jgi:hypothetical protein
MTKTFEVLNSSQPNLTKECWLCLNAQPPFYTGVAVMGNHTWVNLTQCSWGLNSKLSLQQVTGTGNCVRSPKAQLPTALCNQTIDISNNTYYSATSGWWACSTGLTPCIHGTVLNKGNGYCVMVQLFPRITYYEETQMELAFSPIPSSRTKRAIGVAAILLPSLVG